MSRELDDIKQGLSLFAAKYGPSIIVPATVLEVNADDTVKVVLTSGAKIDDVRLKSIVKEGDKWLLIPKVDSLVQIGRIGNSEEWVVVAVHEITKMLLVIGEVTMDVDKDGFLLKKGDVTMRSFLEDLLDAIMAERHLTSYGPTTNLTPDSQQKFNDLKTKAQNLFKDAE